MSRLPPIDWDAAERVGQRLIPAGPVPTREVAEQTVAGLRSASARAGAHVAETARLRPPASDAPTLVIDRASWVRANARAMRALLANLDPADPDLSLSARVQARTIGAQFGAALSYLGTRILGQFEPFGDPQRLLLVAPNILQAQSKLAVNEDDFLMWVCLHEQTHRFQFANAPWLREHLIGQLDRFLNADGVGVPRLPKRGSRPVTMLDVFTSPAQRSSFDQVSATMSVLEGHADVIMDRVGSDVVGSIAVLRRAFDARRNQQGWHAVARRLLGLDLKLAQYREGAAFCRRVIGAAGVDGLNQVFVAPGLLPSLQELRDPDAWVRRVCR